MSIQYIQLFYEHDTIHQTFLCYKCFPKYKQNFHNPSNCCVQKKCFIYHCENRYEQLFAYSNVPLNRIEDLRQRLDKFRFFITQEELMTPTQFYMIQDACRLKYEHFCKCGSVYYSDGYIGCFFAFYSHKEKEAEHRRMIHTKNHECKNDELYNIIDRL